MTGISFRRPPNFRMSMTSPIACITDPDARNSSALKKACVNRWKIAAVTARLGATGPPQPSAMNMNPSWLTVEYASTRLRSVCAMAMNAASSAVSPPTRVTITCAVGDSTNSGVQRASR